MDDDSRDLDGFDGVLMFLGLLVGSIVAAVALLYGFFWLMFDFSN